MKPNNLGTRLAQPWDKVGLDDEADTKFMNPEMLPNSRLAEVFGKDFECLKKLLGMQSARHYYSQPKGSSAGALDVLMAYLTSMLKTHVKFLLSSPLPSQPAVCELIPDSPPCSSIFHSYSSRLLRCRR